MILHAQNNCCFLLHDGDLGQSCMLCKQTMYLPVVYLPFKRTCGRQKVRWFIGWRYLYKRSASFTLRHKDVNWKGVLWKSERVRRFSKILVAGFHGLRQTPLCNSECWFSCHSSLVLRKDQRNRNIYSNEHPPTPSPEFVSELYTLIPKLICYSSNSCIGLWLLAIGYFKNIY